MNDTIRISCRLRLFVGENAFLGRGPITLLENIRKYGSIAKGAEAMQMSYRKAWQLVENMNAIAARPLVNKRLGGKKGGGAEVTQAGLEAIESFYQLEKELDSFLQDKAGKMKFSFL